MKINKNNKKVSEKTISSLLLKKEITCDLPALGTYFMLFLGVTNALFFLSINESALFFGFFFMGFMAVNGLVQGKKAYYQDVFREKVLAMGCPLRSRYEYHRGGSGWCTYAMLNRTTYGKFLSLSLEETPLPLSEEVTSIGPFYKKVLVEKVASKQQIGKTIHTFDTRLKTKAKISLDFI